MTKWNDERYHERFAKFDKIRRTKYTKGEKTLTADKEFELARSEFIQANPDAFPGRVVEVHKGYAFIAKEMEEKNIISKDVWLATVARKFLTMKRQERNLVCVGDQVLCLPDKERKAESDLPQCTILHRTPRSNQISRIDPGSEEREHVLVSNIDQLCIIASYKNPLVKWGLIDRYLVLAELEKIPALIILNKEDTLSDDETFKDDCTKRIDYLRSLGYEILSMQATDVKGKKKIKLLTLSSLLEGKISVVVGHSGVGKSSIVNLLEPEIIQDVEGNPDIFYKGRHTTSYASFLKLKTGGYMIDTPGIRSFLLKSIDAYSLSFGFREFRPYLNQCKFRTCKHDEEPGCKIREQVDLGTISEYRYNSYLGILLGTTGREGRTRDLEGDSDDI